MGKFIKVDDKTLDSSLIGFAKLLVEVDILKDYPDAIISLVMNEDKK